MKTSLPETMVHQPWTMHFFNRWEWTLSQISPKWAVPTTLCTEKKILWDGNVSMNVLVYFVPDVCSLEHQTRIHNNISESWDKVAITLRLVAQISAFIIHCYCSKVLTWFTESLWKYSFAKLMNLGKEFPYSNCWNINSDSEILITNYFKIGKPQKDSLLVNQNVRGPVHVSYNSNTIHKKLLKYLFERLQ